MPALKIMIVEDEIIIAKDIQRILKKIGYEAFDPFSSGKKALDNIDKLNPDLVLLDINLKGSEMDGIHVAQQIHQNYSIPFIFLTAFSDKATLERAKLTEPYGYIIKPFEENDIRTAIEIAHHKHAKDLDVQNKGGQFAAALENLDVAVMIMDDRYKIIFANQMVEAFTGCPKSELMNKDATLAMKNSSTETRDSFKKMVNTFGAGSDKQNGDTTLVVSNGTSEKSLHVSAFPISSFDNKVNGCAFVLSSSDKKDSGNDADKNLFGFLENEYARNSFFVKKDSRYVRVNFQDILWVEALDNYVIVKTASKEQFILHTSMRDIETRLPQNKFARIHRSYIVQLDRIAVIEESSCVVDSNHLPIGKSHRDAFMARVNLF